MHYTEWMRRAATEQARLLALLRALDPADWGRPTDCAGWDVRAVAVHLMGNVIAAASPVEQVRQLRDADRLRSSRPDLDRLDALNEAVQRRFAALPPEHVMARIGRSGPRSLTVRRLLLPPLRSVPVPFGPPLGTVAASYLLGTILTRDAWMHRIDLARATGARLVLDAHDALIVRDIAQEWGRRHGAAVELELTGPAGGRFALGTGPGARLTLDAVQFCRITAGRVRDEGEGGGDGEGGGGGLLATRVSF